MKFLFSQYIEIFHSNLCTTTKHKPPPSIMTNETARSKPGLG